MELVIGGERFELYHAKGETDDATWYECHCHHSYSIHI